MATGETSIGVKLRALRKERQLSQKELAECADLSPAAVSLIERDESSPSVATLQRLAAALQVRMSFFFEGPAESDLILARAGTRPRLYSAGVSIEGLAARLHDQQLEPFYVTLAPHAQAGEGKVLHQGQELVCCIQGQVHYEVNGEQFLLHPGDILLFQATLPHCWDNPGGMEAQLLLVLQAPVSPDDSARRHFAHYPSVTHLT